MLLYLLSWCFLSIVPRLQMREWGEYCGRARRSRNETSISLVLFSVSRNIFNLTLRIEFVKLCGEKTCVLPSPRTSGPTRIACSIRLLQAICAGEVCGLGTRLENDAEHMKLFGCLIMRLMIMLSEQQSRGLRTAISIGHRVFLVMN